MTERKTTRRGKRTTKRKMIRGGKKTMVRKMARGGNALHSINFTMQSIANV